MKTITFFISDNFSETFVSGHLYNSFLITVSNIILDKSKTANKFINFLGK